MKRLFAAVKIEPGELFLKSFRELRNRLGSESIKWVEENNIHITVKFFGDTDESLIPRMSGSLRKIADTGQVLNFRLSGIGIFGSSYQPRVVWTGIEPHEPLALLMKTAQLEMVPLGFEADRQNLVPHLTLGRIKYLKDKQLFQKALESFRSIHSDQLNVKECILYESILRKEGPLYITLEKFPFGQYQKPD